jgi:hypothetical protein
LSTPGQLARKESHASHPAIEDIQSPGPTPVNQPACHHDWFFHADAVLMTATATTLGFAAWVAGLVLGLRTFSQQGLYVMVAPWQIIWATNW